MSEISRVKSSLKRIRDPVVRERLLIVQTAYAAYKMSLRDAAAKFGCTHGKVDSGSGITSRRVFVACIRGKGVADRRR